ncbi:transposon Tn10 TetD protein [Ruminiclostridium hungatei]|uniref:Transposon Tn10 TetD protein n=1 Tax=Ruminiclostridium hungatei TaxID=48256 RepID=A0A1V4SM25_RUMHU|nr:AraC family transcriptional regulator [Ruminiclostridium hungatei]OPX44942.1 transposon Tn10 TetD protein [Ruminiclostridium hungatei]
MEWFERMKNALDYLENSMQGELDIEEAARVAYSSTFHFQRMFHMLTGVTVAEYVRRRRLTLAAQELAASDIRVLDLALKYGYESPEAFSKAFRKLQGISPSAAREAGIELRAYPRISFHISLKGDKDMNYKLIEKSSLKVFGKSKKVSTKNGENLLQIPQFWRECDADGFRARLLSVEGGELFGICMNDYENECFTYLIAREKTKDIELPEGAQEFTIPAATWAVFESVGPMPGTIQKVWERIYSEWFPSTGYEQANAPQLELYPEGDASNDDYKCEVWIPIVKK